jgi:hypothetical protein
MKQLLMLITSMMLVLSCGLFKSSQETIDVEEYAKGKVLDKRDLDGCTYVIELESGKKLEPINLTDDFQKEGLQVWVKYEEKKDIASICMMGTMVEVIDIKKAEYVKAAD